MPLKPEFKVTLLGAGGVGKSALTLRIISGQFTPTYNPTIEDFYRHDTNVDGVGQCIVEILDTAGTEQFASMRQMYINSGEAFALVYSIDNRESFDEVQEIYQQLLEIKRPEALTVVLVGNKSDLVKSREVETFLETSARNGHNVEFFFDTLVKSLDKRIRGGNDKKQTGRKSFRLGTSTMKRQRGGSEPDLRNCNNQTDYHAPAYITARPGKTAARRRCVIM